MKTLLEMLYHEHEEISKQVANLRQMSLKLMADKEFDIAKYQDIIKFIKEYADERHHKKEEQLLFKAMSEHLGVKAENLVRHGMLVEHDLARFQVQALEQAVDKYNKDQSDENRLDIIAQGMGYCYLLERHIEKENKVVYPFGERGLPKDVMIDLNAQAQEYEKKYQCGCGCKS